MKESILISVMIGVGAAFIGVSFGSVALSVGLCLICLAFQRLLEE